MAAPIESGYFASPGPTTVAAAHARPTETQSASTSPTEITGTNSSSRRRGSSITQSLFDANPPPGVWAATGEAIARGPGLAELRRNSSSGGSGPGIIRRMSSSGGSRNGKRKRRESSTSAASPGSDSESGAGSSKSPGNGSKSPRAKGRLHSIFFEELDENNSEEKRASRMSLTSSLSGSGLRESNRDSARPVSRQPENVYSLIEAGERSQTGERSQAGEAPARVSTNIQSRGIDRTSTAGTGRSEGQEREQNPGWMAVTIQALKSFWSWFLTPMGFFLTIYMLNIVAWGGMLFLLLINAAPAMCYAPPAYKFNCNDINSPRRIWVEITSQIMNALFCVTGFGLIPWRFRDLWLLMKWRFKGNQEALSKLRKIHGGWWRPHGIVEKLPKTPNITSTARSTTDITNEKPATNPPPPAPESGTVAEGNVIPEAGTKPWKLDLVIHLYAINTYLQAVLAGFMWGYNRIDRPPWATGLFVALACGVAIAGGGVVWWEGRKLKKMEDRVRQGEDQERGREGPRMKEVRQENAALGRDGMGTQ